MIDPLAHKPAYLQVADTLRERIVKGQLRDGQLLPAEGRLAYDFEVSVSTMRAALRILRDEGLIVTRAPYGTRVRSPRERRDVRVPRGSSVRFVYSLTPEQRREWGVGLGVPAVILLIDPSGRVEVLPADEVDKLTFS